MQSASLSGCRLFIVAPGSAQEGSGWEGGREGSVEGDGEVGGVGGEGEGGGGRDRLQQTGLRTKRPPDTVQLTPWCVTCVL